MFFSPNIHIMTSPNPSFATGSCLCHSIRYTLTTPPLNALICHCLNCRKSTGAAFATNTFYPSSSLQIITPSSSSDLLRTYEDRDTVTGSTVFRQFCGKCGSSLFATNSEREGLVCVTNGTVDGGEVGDEELRPKLEIFCKDRRGWLPPGEGVKRKDVL